MKILPSVLLLFIPILPLKAQEAEGSDQQRQVDLPGRDGAYISLNGVVESVKPHSFVLDTGAGAIQVEMDDFDADADASVLRGGDEVTVYGLLDENLFDQQTIEASSVYVERLNNKVFANSLDEETLAFASTTPLPEDRMLSIQGRVGRTNPHEYEFSLETGASDIRVEVLDLEDNPLDEHGDFKLLPGDSVRVRGKLELDFLEGRELDALNIEKLE